ncbi:unnamed protein product [Paramecium primaurelia]|uniref:Uncharacterized protein n=1 Tax=Paramecium primaurelia TaxID=5886 RepID=A0A8S1N071_PARPR|nr:unnamed protein product [Paramecium primaurelia]
MFNFLASLNSKSNDNPNSYERVSQSINTGLWIEHFKIKSINDFSLIALQQIQNEELVTGLYKITYHFDLDKLIYQKFCKYLGKKQYCKISKKLEDFFLIINSNSSLIHYNILNNKEDEIKAKEDYKIQGLKLTNNQSMIVLYLRSKQQNNIEIQLRSIFNSTVLLQVFNLCSNWNLEYLSVQRIDQNNMIGVIMEQDQMEDYQIYIKRIINKKIVKIQIINTFSNHFVDSKIYTLQGIDCNFQQNEYSKGFKLQTIKHQKILRQLCIRRFEFYKVIDKKIILICESIGFGRFRIFRYDIKTGNQIDLKESDDIIGNIQKLKLEMNKLYLCKYRWQLKKQEQDTMFNLKIG